MDLTARLAVLKSQCLDLTVLYEKDRQELCVDGGPEQLIHFLRAIRTKVPSLIEYVQQVEASVCAYCHDEALRQARKRLETALEGAAE